MSPWQQIDADKSVFEASVTDVHWRHLSFCSDEPESVLFFSFFFFLLKDAAASYDFNDNDPDPFPRYDSTNENKWVSF